LLQATNRTLDAEQLFFRCLVITRQFELLTGYAHPNEQVYFDNYTGCLEDLGYSLEQIEARFVEARETAQRELPSPPDPPQ